MHTLDPYINNILEAKGYKDMLPEVKEALRKDLQIRIDDLIMARTVTVFTEEELREFEKMLDEKKSRAELQKFAIDHIPNYTAFLSSTLLEFQNVFLAGK